MFYYAIGNHMKDVLVIEDDESLNECYHSLFNEHKDFTPRFARSREEAIKEIDTKCPDIILLDYKLGDVFVDELASYIHKVCDPKGTKLVLVSAWSSPEKIAEKLAIKTVIKKPFDVDVLFNKLLE